MFRARNTTARTTEELDLAKKRQSMQPVPPQDAAEFAIIRFDVLSFIHPGFQIDLYSLRTTRQFFQRRCVGFPPVLPPRQIRDVVCPRDFGRRWKAPVYLSTTR